VLLFALGFGVALYKFTDLMSAILTIAVCDISLDAIPKICAIM